MTTAELILAFVAADRDIARDLFNRAIAGERDAGRAAGLEVAREYATNRAFRVALEQETFERNWNRKGA
jgi:hypothetical protein